MYMDEFVTSVNSFTLRCRDAFFTGTLAALAVPPLSLIAIAT